MERKLKERVTGAALLVLIAIIVIPWVLDGDVAAPVKETEILLPAPVTTVVISGRDGLDRPPMPGLPQAQSTAPARTPPGPATQIEPMIQESPEPAVDAPAIVAQARQEQDPPEPAPVPKAPTASKPAPKAVVEKPAALRRTPAPAPAPVAADPTSGWAVQVGSFSSQANANKLTARLVDLQYKAFVSRKSVNGRVWYRVRIGPRATRAEAVELSERLKSDSQAVAIVPHPG